MTNPVEPTAARVAYPARRILILLAALAAPAIGYGQQALGIGLSPGRFAADGDETLRVASYAFAIWGVIYAWLIAYAVYQALPSTREDAVLERLGWPSFWTLAGLGIWVAASAADLKWLTVAVITASLLSLLAPFWSAGAELRQASARQRLFVVWPLALLTGWLTIASIVNLSTVATAAGALPAFLTPEAWGLVALAAVGLIALAVTWRIAIWTYPLPIVWGLIGVFAAERAEGDLILANVAAGVAGLLAVLSVIRSAAKADTTLPDG